ncbi:MULTISPECIES: hypothetical protein [unclassified Bradyrhizobium]|uniref:hypothetical protein n=1 Tax=unclassified Bradyrhizobium TaxID=2631580 RepID=UPI0008902389|nr:MULTISPECIES: hypothetical protein [unclassified Bradyrhizobium]SDG85203.1 hypothetical protein SAMN05216338_1003204 [Bradyrhizobium sp. Rc2d]
MGASGESLRPIVMLLAEYTLGLKVKGNAVDKSRSKAESCSSRRFSTALRSAPGRSLLRNRRQRQISFRSHLISLNVSSIEVITDVDHFVPGVSSMAIVIERPFLGSAFLPNNCIRGLATSARSFGEQFDVCNSYQSISPYTARVTRNRGRSSRFHGAAIVCLAQFLRSTGLIGARTKTENRRAVKSMSDTRTAQAGAINAQRMSPWSMAAEFASV